MGKYATLKVVDRRFRCHNSAYTVDTHGRDVDTEEWRQGRKSGQKKIRQSRGPTAFQGSCPPNAIKTFQAGVLVDSITRDRLVTGFRSWCMYDITETQHQELGVLCR